MYEIDTTSSPNELLNLLHNSLKGRNYFGKALKAPRTAISNWWDDTRPPVIIFLSDGITSFTDSVVQRLSKNGVCNVRQVFNVKPTFHTEKDSLHAILFGLKTTSTRMERMITIALNACIYELTVILPRSA